MLRIDNPARTRLEANQLSIGVGIKVARTTDVARIMNACGFDWLFLDMEHGALSIDTVAQLSVAALDAEIAPIVRIRIGDFGTATTLLDCGALGIVHPHIETADEARAFVDAVRYPPIGHRGVGGPMPQFRYRPVKLADAVAELNRATLIAVMLETPEAVSRADEIAAVKGLDIVMIGTNDLALAMGHPAEFGHHDVVKAYETVAAACKKHGKWLGSGGVYDVKLVQRYVEIGVRFHLSVGDVRMIITSGQQAVKELREVAIPAG
jgi:2-keto-3-deoxy-L-rhamnonate aldolase RhmA